MATKPEPVSAAGSAFATVGIDGGRDDVPPPALPVAAVARRLGVAPATLRTWDRRYGLGPSGRTTGRHRRYGPVDITRLELMQHALLRGASPAEAAAYALRVPIDAPAVANHDAPDGAIRRTDGATPVRGDAAPSDIDPGVLDPASVGLPDRLLRSAGGRARGLGGAALAMDSVGVQRLLDDAIAACGVAGAWDTVIRPVLAAVAGYWATSGRLIEVEHLLRECVLAAMIRATPLVDPARNPRPILLCCVADERHSLPLYVLRAALAHRGLGTQLLGAALPTDALIAAVHGTAPAGVVLWAQLRRHAKPAVFERLPTTREPMRLFAGGPGWTPADLPPRVELLDELATATDLIERGIELAGRGRCPA